MSKRQEIHEKRKKPQNRGNLVPIIIIAAAALVIAFILIWPSLQPVGNVVVPTISPKPQANGLSMGNPDAPVKIIEYADFQCPACKTYWKQIEPGLITDYIAAGKVYLTYTPFSFIGAESFRAAEAAYCANDQGKFWEYRDMLYANQTVENGGDFTDKRLGAFAGKIGLDTNAFNSCLSSGTYTQKVKDDGGVARKQNVTFTPTFDVNGKQVDAPALLDTIKAALGPGN